jgi:hypothetical protein
MCDGKPEKSGGLTLCTDSFSIEDIKQLIFVLTMRYDFKCSVHHPRPNQYRIYFSKKSMESLRKIVAPYVVSSMLQKIKIKK